MELRIVVWFSLLAFFQLELRAQSYPEDPSQFYGQAVRYIESLNNEAAFKVSYDFKNAWQNEWTGAQREKIATIGHEMWLKGYDNMPDFWNLFAYLAYAQAQERLDAKQLNGVLAVNEQSLEYLSRSSYRSFLYGLNLFFARRYLAYEPKFTVQAKGGTYTFEVADMEVEASNLPEKMVEEVPLAVDTAFNVEINPWAGGDPFDDPDPFAVQEDPFAAPEDWTEDDPFGVPNEQPLVDVLPVGPTVLEKKQDSYFIPPAKGPLVRLNRTNLLIRTPNDSNRFTKTNGYYLLDERTFVGETATFEWPGEYDKMEGTRVKLGKFVFQPTATRFQTPFAELFNERLSPGGVFGEFTFRPTRKLNGKLSNYPVFASLDDDLSVEINEQVRYVGGLEIRGQQFYGRALSGKRGTLYIKNEAGQEIHLISGDFVLGDSMLSAQDAMIAIVHGSDSVYHPSVVMSYHLEDQYFVAYKTKKQNITPFRSTFFKVDVAADIIRWDMKTQQVSLDISNGKMELPLIVESLDYFSPERYDRLKGIFRFHPIDLVVGFARDQNRQTFYIDDLMNDPLVKELKVSKPLVEGAIKQLYLYGFVAFDQIQGRIKVKARAYLYYNAVRKMQDHDYFYVEGLSPDSTNAVWSLDSGQMVIRGVQSFSLVKGYKVKIEPDHGKLTLMKNRSFLMDGEVEAGDFIYDGRNFEFDYDAFSINMAEIDSMRLNVLLADSVAESSTGEQRMELNNNISSTAGTLFLEMPDNKSSNRDNKKYPLFTTDSDAVVYFDGPEILNGAYDRTVKFILPPFEVDSIDREAGDSFAFDGQFVSGGMFPKFTETLTIQPDRSLGFVHQIPGEGYNLYETEARTYDRIRLSNDGLRGEGKIDFLTATLYSDDFIYYPDSVTSMGNGGAIREGDYRGVSYPEAIFGAYDMHWMPRKDSMYIRNVDAPFKFYQSTAELDGEMNITTKGVFGEGTMHTRGAISTSDDYTFSQYAFTARNAHFEIATDNPEKPAMEGENIELNFDLASEVAAIRPEQRGYAALSFPYAQMKTSITQAVWDLPNGIVTMTKPEQVAIEDSYFYSERPELDSLVFSGRQAVYDIDSYDLTVEGIPYIVVADSKIIPEENRTTIRENSQLQPFDNATIVIDTLNGYHTLTNGNIKINSRNSFEGSAYYLVAFGEDTFQIRFDSFELKEVPVSPKEWRLMTVSGGEVAEAQNLKIAPGFYYKGSVEMFAYKEALELSGSVRMDVQNLKNRDLWIPYDRKNQQVRPHVPIENAIFDSGQKAIAGIQIAEAGHLYATFLEPREEGGDKDFFRAYGDLSYEEATGTYLIETSSKSAGAYAGHSMFYNDLTSEVLFEGPVSFFDDATEGLKINASVSGSTNKRNEKYTLDAFLSLSVDLPASLLDVQSRSAIEAIERLGAPPANEVTDDLLYKLANIIGEKETKRYKDRTLEDYVPLINASKELNKAFVISGVRLEWDPGLKTWHNSSKIGISNLGKNDINAQVNGFLEIGKDDVGADLLSLFLEFAPDVWIYLGYTKNNLVFYSSNKEVNDIVASKSNLGKEKPGELLFVLGEVNEVTNYINDFRSRYLGINEPYQLLFPSDTAFGDGFSKDLPFEEEDNDGF